MSQSQHLEETQSEPALEKENAPNDQSQLLGERLSVSASAFEEENAPHEGIYSYIYPHIFLL